MCAFVLLDFSVSMQEDPPDLVDLLTERPRQSVLLEREREPLLTPHTQFYIANQAELKGRN